MPWNHMGKIFYIMGKSASGKDHIYARLMQHTELNLKKMVLYTTRPIRDGEEEGKQYFFTDEEKLKEFRRKGCVIEARSYSTMHGIWYYFTADDGQVDLARLTRALNREKEQEKPKYEEMCRRFLADQADFSEENILKAGIWKRFQNVELADCVEEIVGYIKTQ